jgi:hypothetical protein
MTKPTARPEDNPLSPKRRTVRRRRALEVEIQGAGPRFKAKTVDVSREGMFVEVVDPAFLPPDKGRGLIAFATRTHEEFPHGLTAHFGAQGVTARADVVRVALQPGEREVCGLGCRFAAPLGDEQCVALGISAESKDASKAPGAGAPTARASGDRRSESRPGGGGRREADLELPPARHPATPPAPPPAAAPAVPAAASDAVNPLAAKREDRRVERRFPILLKGAKGKYKASTVDLSSGGALVEVVDPEFLPAGSRTFVGFAAKSAEEFGATATLEFGGGSVLARGKMVRVVAGGEAMGGARIGLRFDPPLAAAQCVALGIGQPGMGDLGINGLLAAILADPAPTTLSTGAAPSGETRVHAGAKDGDEPSFEDLVAGIARKRAANPQRPATPDAPKGSIVVHLFPRNGPLAGPRYVGVLHEVRGKAVQVDVDLPAGETDPVVYAAGAGRDVRVVFLRDGRVLWEVNAKTLFVSDPKDGSQVRLTLVPAKPPPKSLARRFDTRAAS